jgi:hypothetical protein
VVPVAISSAAVSSLFLDSSQALDWGQLTVRRLERIYGKGRPAWLKIRSGPVKPGSTDERAMLTNS